MESVDESLLNEKPRDPREGLMNRKFLRKMSVEGSLIALATILAFSIGLKKGEVLASTMAFFTITLARLFHGFNCRGEGSIREIGLKSNHYSLYAFAAGVLFLGIVTGIPSFHSLFQIQAMTWKEGCQAAVLAFLPTLVIQSVREINHIKKQNN